MGPGRKKDVSQFGESSGSSDLILDPFFADYCSREEKWFSTGKCSDILLSKEDKGEIRKRFSGRKGKTAFDCIRFEICKKVSSLFQVFCVDANFFFPK